MLTETQKHTRRYVYDAAVIIAVIMLFADLATVMIMQNTEFTPVSVLLVFVVCGLVYLPTERADAALYQVAESGLRLRILGSVICVRSRRKRILLNGTLLTWMCINKFFVFMLCDMTRKNVTVQESLPALIPTLLSKIVLFFVVLSTDVYLSTHLVHPVAPPEP